MKVKFFQPKSPSKQVPVTTRRTYVKLEGKLRRLRPVLALSEPPRAGHRKNSDWKDEERGRRKHEEGEKKKTFFSLAKKKKLLIPKN